MNAFVDIQGFKTDDNKFILKEMAILCNGQMQVFLVKPPFKFYDLSKSERLQVCWIERNRNILWNEGFIPFCHFQQYTGIVNILKDKCIIAKGMEKIVWLRELLKNNCIYNIEDKDCPSFISLYEKYNNSLEVKTCMYHKNVCALKNVLCLSLWSKDNKVF